MKKNDRHRMMSGLDWFAICTGLIGLVADFITIATLAQIDGPHHTFPIFVWIIAPPLIMYTTIVLSFYTRRTGLVRHLNTKRLLSAEALYKINKGGVVAAQVIGTPLLLLYGVCCIISFASKGNLPTAIFLIIVFGTPVALIISGILSWIAGTLYAAFDPRYVAVDRKNKGLVSEQVAAPDRQDTAPTSR